MARPENVPVQTMTPSRTISRGSLVVSRSQATLERVAHRPLGNRRSPAVALDTLMTVHPFQSDDTHRPNSAAQHGDVTRATGSNTCRSYGTKAAARMSTNDRGTGDTGRRATPPRRHPPGRCR